MDENREHGVPIAHHFRKNLIYILYNDIIFSMDSFLLKKSSSLIFQSRYAATL